MFKQLCGLFLIFSCLSITSWAASVPEYLDAQYNPNWLERSSTIPIPWGMEQPFPWDSISGVWQATVAQKAEIVSNFVFKVVREESTGVRQLFIREVSRERGIVLAEGVGRQFGKVVEAQMTTPRGEVYAVKIRSFSTKDYPVKVSPNQYVTSNSILIMSAILIDRPFVVTHFHLGRLN